jgi:hypothetical protein
MIRRRYTLVIKLGDARLRKVLVEVPDPDYAESLTPFDCFDDAIMDMLSDWAGNYVEMTYPAPLRVSWYIERERVELPVRFVVLEPDPRD